MDSEDLKDIFYSGYSTGPNWQILDELYVAITQGNIVYESIVVASKLHYDEEVDRSLVPEGPGPQMRSHMALKALAGSWLQAHKQKPVLYEAYLLGLHPDVRTQDGMYIIECGTTDPSCVLIYLDSPDTNWVGVLPYPFADDQELILQIFSKGSMYEQWRQKRLDILRSQFRKFHR